MKRFSLLNPPCVLAEFGPGSLKILDGADGLELSLERADNGRLTSLCIERLIESLRVFFGRKAWPSRRRVVCAIGARGISLRRLTLPRASRMELERLVLLQIEREFPLLPEELAWGFIPVDGQGASGTNEVLVAAIKHDLLQQYEEVFAGCELTPTFTVGALARPWACPQAPSTCTVLDLGRTSSELVTLVGGVPTAIRTLPFGGETVTLAIQARLSRPRIEAEKLKLDLHNPSAPVANAAAGDDARAVIAAEVAALAAMIAPGWVQGKLLLTGGSARLDGLPEALARSVGPGSTCERVPLETGEGCSAAILGLRAHGQNTGEDPPLVLRRCAPTANPSRNARNNAANAWKWAALAAVLAVACGSLRFVAPVFGLAGMNRRVAELRARQARMPAIDRDLAFLQHLRTNQPPYLDLIHTLADSSPSGTRLDAITLNRRGDLSVRATLRNTEEVIAFRSKLDGSARFASVVVDEQTPSPDQQKVAVRITGQRATALARESPPVAPGPALPAVKPGPDLKSAPVPAPAPAQVGQTAAVPPAAAGTNANRGVNPE